MISVNDIAKVKRDARGASTLFSDDEIEQILEENNEIHELAVAQIYEALAADASTKGTLRVGKYSESFETQATNFTKLAELWRRKVVTRKPYAGGISKTDKETRELDTDRVQPLFKKGMGSRTDASE